LCASFKLVIKLDVPQLSSRGNEPRPESRVTKIIAQRSVSFKK
jgi:hypothetical protein